jgi:hypothetical protein
VEISPRSHPGQATVLPVVSQSGLVEGTRLVLVRDGTWYAIDSSGGGTLRIVVPQYSLNSDSSPTLTSPEHIRVTGAATKDTTISAPGYIFLGNGFRVPLGKTLSVKQPEVVSPAFFHSYKTAKENRI